MHWRGCAIIGLLVGAAACAGTSETHPSATVAGSGGGGGAMTSSTGGGDAMGLAPQSCPDGTYASDLDGDGMLVCSALDVDVTAVNEQCSLYFGWRDGCSGCTSGPSKVGRVNGLDCENLAGADDTCGEPMLGSSTLPVFGLNTDGDVDDNDMFYLGWHCPADGETSLPGPCGADERAVGVMATGQIECMPLARVVAQYVREHCSVYLGWRDGCDGCTEPPSKWGVQRGIDCEIGAGSDSVCGAPFAGKQWVPMVGINTDGDVDDNDTFFVGLSCDAGSSDVVAAGERCPFGTLLAGINDDGTLQCADPSAAIAPAVRDACRLTFGYRDDCGGCTDPPAKWGSVWSTGCDAAASSSCGTHTLGSDTVELLGIRTDGDVDGNDKLYVGLSCNGAS